jgi:hypothetical protein
MGIRQPAGRDPIRGVGEHRSRVAAEREQIFCLVSKLGKSDQMAGYQKAIQGLATSSWTYINASGTWSV